MIFLYDRMSIGKMKICVYSNTAKAPEFAPLGLLSVVERGISPWAGYQFLFFVQPSENVCYITTVQCDE